MLNYLSLPPLMWLPLPLAVLAAYLLRREARRSRLLVAGTCLLQVVGPFVSVSLGSPLHGGELFVLLYAFFGLVSWVFAVPGLLLWKGRDVIPSLPAI